MVPPGLPGRPRRGMKEVLEMEVRLDDVQERAVEMALAEPASIITGGPGRGKTTLVREIIRRACAGGPKDILLAAPTGRAARRLSELTGCEARTIHRLLEYHPDEGFRRHRDNPLQGDMLIMDECSMIDLPLMSSLLRAVPRGMCLVLVGDADQLPPVGPGAPFQDLIRAGRLPVTRLERVYRQDAGSIIPRNAALVNSGRLPATEPGNPSYVRKVYARGFREKMAAGVLKYVETLLAEGHKPDDIQVLVPRRDGVLGIKTLNPRLRDLLNPSGRDRGVFKAGEREFWVGDRVMHLVNNYDKGVFNGEIGIVMEVTDIAVVNPLTKRHEATPGMVVGYEDGTGKFRLVTYTAGDASEVDLAYASTVHKAQGGEFPAVVFALAMDAWLMLRRNLVYTGMTRARERVILLTEQGALETAVKTPGTERRHSWLAEGLVEAV